MTNADHAHILCSEGLARDLWQAVWDMNIDKVQELLDQGADPNHEIYWSDEWISRDRLPLLHSACYYGELENVKVLIQGGADTEKGDSTFYLTPLQQAIYEGEKEVMEYLTKEVKCKVGE